MCEDLLSPSRATVPELGGGCNLLTAPADCVLSLGSAHKQLGLCVIETCVIMTND